MLALYRPSHAFWVKKKKAFGCCVLVWPALCLDCDVVKFSKVKPYVDNFEDLIYA